MKDIDEILNKTLAANDRVNENLKESILVRASKYEKTKAQTVPFVSFQFRISLALAILLILSAAAFAVWKIRTSREVAEHFDDKTLATAFDSENAWIGNEVQEYGGYKVSLIGMVSGKEISDHLVTSDGNVIGEGSYAVVTIEHSDGTPMPDTMDEAYDNEMFLVSPYIEGLDPQWFNIFSFGGGGYSAFVENGIQYRLVHMANIEPFADRTIYLGVSDGVFFNRDAYRFDEQSGKISRNEDYTGLNALFILPIDPQKSDTQRAKELLYKADPIKASEILDKMDAE